jgi:chromosome segregation ATPase
VSVKVVKNHDQLDQNAKLALEQLKMPPEVIKEGQVLKFDLPTAQQIVQLGIGQEVERVYQRQLREYSLVLREMARQLPLLVDNLEAATDENKAAVAALADAKMHQTFNEKEIANLETELERLQGEAKAVAEYRGSLEANLAAVKARIDELFAQNRELADKLSQAQLQGVQRAERATAATRQGAR